MADTDIKEYGIPRIIVPLAAIPGVQPESPLPAREGRPEPDSFGNPEQSGNIPYVMRSKKFGSTDPDDDTAALGLDEANPDTWFRYDPPYKKTVAVSGVSTTGNPTTITTAAHDVPLDIGGTFTVVLAGLTTTPDNANATHQATRTGATTFTIPINVTGASDVTGTAAILTSGVTIDEEPRIYTTGSITSAYLFTRQKKFDRAGELYYISGETKTQIVAPP